MDPSQAQKQTYDLALEMHEDSSHFVLAGNDEIMFSAHKSFIEGKRLLSALSSPGCRMLTREYIKFLVKRK